MSKSSHRHKTTLHISVGKPNLEDVTSQARNTTAGFLDRMGLIQGMKQKEAW